MGENPERLFIFVDPEEGRTLEVGRIAPGQLAAVTKFEPLDPAKETLRIGDEIVSVNGKKCRSLFPEDIKRAFRSSQGQHLIVEIIRRPPQFSKTTRIDGSLFQQWEFQHGVKGV